MVPSLLSSRDRTVCPERHRLMEHLDQPLLPASAALEVS